MEKAIKRIGVFSSGGDAPGMNAAIRAVVRTASFYNLEVFGIVRGYEGMIERDFRRLERKDVANIIHRGGTFLKTARSERFRTAEGRQAAFDALTDYGIDACVAIGGNGTFTGAKIFSEEFQIPFIGIPGTIDNDLYGTDYTIGFDTAVNTAVESVDRIRDTADSHNRLFFIEVMGRHAGFIALHTAISSGAECLLIPEVGGNLDQLVEYLVANARRRKLFSLVVVAEGNTIGPTPEIARLVQQRIPDFDIRYSIIGHLQRGGAPSSMDRVLASRLGYSAVEGLLNLKIQNAMVGIVNDNVQFTPFSEAINREKPIHHDMVRMAEILAM